MRAVLLREHVVGLVVILVAGVVFLSVGYWLSDLAYQADLWPIGAVMRVMLFLTLVGFVVRVFMGVVALINLIFTNE